MRFVPRDGIPADLRAEFERGQRERYARFQRSPFPLYALQSNRSGSRELGRTQAADNDLRSLSLVLRVGPGAGPGEQFEVIVHAVPRPEGEARDAALLREVAALLDTPVLDADGRPFRSSERTEAMLAAEGPATTVSAVVDIDGQPVQFKGLRVQGAWAMEAAFETHGITVTGRDVSSDGLQLVRVDDIESYLSAE